MSEHTKQGARDGDRVGLARSTPRSPLLDQGASHQRRAPSRSRAHIRRARRDRVELGMKDEPNRRQLGPDRERRRRRRKPEPGPPPKRRSKTLPDRSRGATFLCRERKCCASTGGSGASMAACNTLPLALPTSRRSRRAVVRSPWLRGVVWDGFWMQSALWLVPVALWLAYGYSNPAKGHFDHSLFRA